MAKYIIVEMQTNASGKTSLLTDQKDDRNEAESAYYYKLAAAAISKVPMHSVVLLQDNGAELMSGYYDHTENA